KITVHNRGSEAAELHLLPTLWFRNAWSWEKDAAKPMLHGTKDGTIRASHGKLGDRTLACEGNPELLFTENESNAARLWGQANPSPYVKDAFHDCMVSGRRDAGNPAHVGTKAAAHYGLDIPAGGSRTIRIRLARAVPEDGFRDFDRTFADRV